MLLERIADRQPESHDVLTRVAKLQSCQIHFGEAYLIVSASRDRLLEPWRFFCVSIVRKEKSLKRETRLLNSATLPPRLLRVRDDMFLVRVEVGAYSGH